MILRDKMQYLLDSATNPGSSASKDYIVPYCSNVDPTDGEYPRATVAAQEPVFDVLERALASDDKRHILVLADSGMGKTTLLLNLVARKQRHRCFALVPLGEAGALERLDAIPNKGDTVLLLDAFDEDPRAIEDAEARMEEIMTAAALFKCVVMTCRTQFFPSDDKISHQTEIKHVAARKAGSPVLSQWLTVYLQPFNHQQIKQYVRRAIPWWRIAQRSKAKRIVADISDLAARPMLTALIPDLAASEREVRSLWDLYDFMVQTWIQKESSWIGPDALQKIAKAIAIELIDKRSVGGAERISPEELVELPGIKSVPVETWQLSSRSLLNRDADGHYKFAHRSILEFFFIKAFIEGEQRCLSMKWTGLMRDLFLSWGLSERADDKLALQLLSADFRATSLFPIAERHRPSAKLDANWVETMFSTRASVGARTTFPNSWRSAVAHVIRRDAMARVYDIADGLVWQVDLTNDIPERGDRHIYQHHRYSLSGTDDKAREWAVVDLYELKSLCDLLDKKGALDSVIDERELYWLADAEDGVSSALARIRTSGSGQELFYPNLEFVQSGANDPKRSYSIDVYRVATKGAAIDKVEAMTILAYHGDAAALLADDNSRLNTSSWSMHRKSKLPGSLSRPPWLSSP